ncbi:EexN family lipoprotein [Aureimonas altamirensis]|uniref:EexN family lipoprotein n=1 Tax=Aureimonas altamirensis TaxID=370622 RepID=UPI0025554802|nr:EexN family lipoprotein [Aureimonas altamirensis]
MALLLPLAACGNEQDVADEPETEATPIVRDVQYFLDTPDEREAVVDECDNNPGELAETPNCENAYEADRRAMSQGIRDALGQN